MVARRGAALHKRDRKFFVREGHDTDA